MYMSGEVKELQIVKPEIIQYYNKSKEEGFWKMLL